MGRARVLITAGRLHIVATAICRHAGCSELEAMRIADHLVDANLAGHDSHGINNLPMYVSAIRDGGMKLGRHLGVVRDAGAILLFDGGGGVGQMLAHEAMSRGIERARSEGVALVGLRNSHHLGRVGAWAEQCAAASCASVHFVNVVGHQPYVAPFGGRDGRYATNPFCAGLPATADNPPIILDIATSRIAFGKIAIARNRGQSVPEGAVLDATGQPTLDPNDMFTDPPGALLPFGEHKGSGIALFCELLGGVLTGGGTNQPATPRHNTIINNMLSIIIDPAALVESEWMRREVDALVAWVKASPPRDGVEEVLVAGEPERRNRAARLRDGIPIDPVTWDGVIEAAVSVGCNLDAVGKPDWPELTGAQVDRA